MSRARHMAAACVLALAGIAGVGVTAAWDDVPVDARPLQDPPQDPPTPAPTEPAPAGAPAPDAPVPVTPPGGAEAIARAVEQAQQAEERAPAEDEAEEKEDAEEETAAAPPPAEPSGPPGRRQRRPVAIVQAVDKVTAETMRFEVEVNGRPVAFKKQLIFRARACEVSASDERQRDAVAYMEVSVQPRPGAGGEDGRQIFRGWMFASSPGVSGLQHPVYDAWIVGCRA